MALANTITLDPGTGTRNPFTGALPANLQEHINNEAFATAITSALFQTLPVVMVGNGSIYATTSPQPHIWIPAAGQADPATIVAGDQILR